MRRPLIAGNWKMNGSKADSSRLLQSLVNGCADIDTQCVDLAVFPPFVYLEQTEKMLTGSCLAWGAQNISGYDSGAYTGEVSATMLRDFHCRYVIIGHSERRRLYCENDHVIANKFIAALRGGLLPILCVGETQEQQENGQTESVVKNQLQVVFEQAQDELNHEFIIAYEPVWAIGTGKNATPEQAQAVHALIRNFLNQRDKKLAEKTRLLYGGSVNAKNALSLLQMPDIDGVLIGNASLDANQFIEIGKQCKSLS